MGCDDRGGGERERRVTALHVFLFTQGPKFRGKFSSVSPFANKLLNTWDSLLHLNNVGSVGSDFYASRIHIYVP